MHFLARWERGLSENLKFVDVEGFARLLNSTSSSELAVQKQLGTPQKDRLAFTHEAHE